MPQFEVTFISKGDKKTRTKKLLGDRVSDIFAQLYEIEKQYTIVTIENTSLSKD